MSCGTQQTGQYVLVTPQSEFDAGTVPLNTLVSHSFLVRNAVDYALTIDDVRTSCGCLSATIEPTVLLPGANGQVDVQIKATTTKQVDVFLQSSLHTPKLLGKLRLTVRVDASNRIMIEPSTIDLGHAPPGVQAQASVSVTCLVGHDEDPSVIVESDSWLRASLGTPFVENDGAGGDKATYPLDLVIDTSSLPLGTSEGVVWLRATSTKVLPARLPVRIVIAKGYTADPPSVFLGMDLTRHVERRVRLRRVSPMRVHNVLSRCPEVTVNWDASAPDAETLDLDVSYSPSTPAPDAIRSILVVEFDGEPHSTLEIPILGGARD
jgi:hypothetical protein